MKLFYYSKQGEKKMQGKNIILRNWIHCLNHAKVARCVRNGEVRLFLSQRYFMAGRRKFLVPYGLWYDTAYDRRTVVANSLRARGA